MLSRVGRGPLFHDSFTGMKLQVESLSVSSWLLVVLIALGFQDLQLCGSNGLCHHMVTPPPPRVSLSSYGISFSYTDASLWVRTHPKDFLLTQLHL